MVDGTDSITSACGIKLMDTHTSSEVEVNTEVIDSQSREAISELIYKSLNEWMCLLECIKYGPSDGFPLQFQLHIYGRGIEAPSQGIIL